MTLLCVLLISAVPALLAQPADPRRMDLPSQEIPPDESVIVYQRHDTLPERLSLPFRRALSITVHPGIGSDGGYFWGQLTAWYGTPKLRAGIGAGHAGYKVRVNKETFLLFARTELHSEEFRVDFLPVFAGFALSLGQKQATPYLIASIGISIPLTGSASAPATYYTNFLGIDSDTKGILTVNRIKTGFYSAFAFGLKYRITPWIELGTSMGFDFSINTFSGTYTETSSASPVTAGYSSTHVSGGLTGCLTIGVNLPIDQP